jgi:hypothetical protein
MGEEVEVLAVIPVGVTHHGYVNVLGCQTSGLESFQQHSPPSGMPNIHQNALLALNEDAAAKSDYSDVGPNRCPLKQYVDFHHHGLPSNAFGKWTPNGPSQSKNASLQMRWRRHEIRQSMPQVTICAVIKP